MILYNKIHCYTTTIFWFILWWFKRNITKTKREKKMPFWINVKDRLNGLRKRKSK